MPIILPGMDTVSKVVQLLSEQNIMDPKNYAILIALPKNIIIFTIYRASPTVQLHIMLSISQEGIIATHLVQTSLISTTVLIQHVYRPALPPSSPQQTTKYDTATYLATLMTSITSTTVHVSPSAQNFSSNSTTLESNIVTLFVLKTPIITTAPNNAQINVFINSESQPSQTAISAMIL